MTTPPVQFEPIVPSEYEDWVAVVRDRLAERLVSSASLTAAEAVTRLDAMIERLLPDGNETDGQSLLNIRCDGAVVGHLWLAVADGDATVYDIEIVGAHAAAVMEAVESTARGNGATAIKLNVFSHDQATARLIAGRGYEPSATQMRLRLDNVPTRVTPVTDITLRPMTQPQFEDFMESEIASFAADLAQSGVVSTAKARDESARQFAELLPDGLESDGDLLWSAYDREGGTGGPPVGLLWVELGEHAGELRAFVYDVLVHQEFRRRGYGRAIMISGERECARLGAKAIGLNVFGFNAGARELYDALGYQVIEEFMRKSFAST